MAVHRSACILGALVMPFNTVLKNTCYKELPYKNSGFKNRENSNPVSDSSRFQLAATTSLHLDLVGPILDAFSLSLCHFACRVQKYTILWSFFFKINCNHFFPLYFKQQILFRISVLPVEWRALYISDNKSGISSYIFFSF